MSSCVNYLQKGAYYLFKNGFEKYEKNINSDKEEKKYEIIRKKLIKMWLSSKIIDKENFVGNIDLLNISENYIFKYYMNGECNFVYLYEIEKYLVIIEKNLSNYRNKYNIKAGIQLAMLYMNMKELDINAGVSLALLLRNN